MKKFTRLCFLLWIFGIMNLSCLAIEDLDNERPISHFCPLSHDLLVDPVLAADTITYERVWIERWFMTCRSSGLPVTSPITREVLMNTDLRFNRLAKDLIDEWRREYNHSPELVLNDQNDDEIPISNPEFANMNYDGSWAMNVEKNPLLRILKPLFC